MNYKDTKEQKDYNNSFSVNDIFNFKLSGLSTKNDNFCIKHSRNELSEVIIDLKTQDAEELKKKYNISNESSSWSLTGAIQDVNTNYSDTKIVELAYRPFDTRFSYYTGNSMGFMGRPKGDLGNHLINSKNLSLVTVKKSRSSSVWNLISVANKMICEPTTITSLDGNYGFPLYLYPAETNNQQLTTTKTERVPNLNQEIVQQLAKTLGLTFTPEKETESNVCFANSSEITNNFKTTFAPIDILDYIYAVLHSPTYREKYKEFLKIDFPRVPYPTNTNTFWQLVNLGGELRQLHLLESPTVENFITSYPKGGDNTITTKVGTKDWELFDTENQLGRIWINEEQYFDNIPLVAWEFYIGGYQPAQKWLKDRKDRILEMEDIFHYQKIIVALTETDRLMKEIDKITIE